MLLCFGESVRAMHAAASLHSSRAEMKGGGEATVVLSPPRGGKANERRPAGWQEQEGLAKVAMANPR